jgi:hypothetical protein
VPANKKAYQQAYERAVEGRSPRSFVQILMGAFEDEYTRKSRLSGASDGAAARRAAAGRPASGEMPG